MILLVLGGGASGKSEYAETEVLRLSGKSRRFYIATMEAYGEAGEYRVRRHRALRAGKGFETIEQPRNIGGIASQIALLELQDDFREDKKSALLEDLSNLLANEFFSEERAGAEERIAEDIRALAGVLEHLVIVSNNIFEDGCGYDEETVAYIDALGRLNCRIAEIADCVVEVVAGIPVALKPAGGGISPKEQMQCVWEKKVCMY